MFIGIISQRSITIDGTFTSQTPASWSANLAQYRQDVGGYVADNSYQLYTVAVVNYDGGSMHVPNPSGYTFDGWYTFSSNKGSSASINIDQATVRISTSSTIGYQAVASSAKTYTDRLGSVYYMVYPKWKQTFRVTFQGNGGTPAEQYEECASGASVTCPSAPTRTGYSFLGWYTAASGGSKVGDAGSTYYPTASITLYAQWSMIWYTVSYNSHGGSPCASGSGGVDSSVTLPSTTRTGYWFLGWYEHYNESTGEYTSFVGGAWATYTPTASITLHAKWQSRLYELGYDNVFLLYDWILNGSSASLTPEAQAVGTLGTWPYGAGAVNIYGLADGYYADIYTHFNRNPLSSNPVYTFPVSSNFSPYTVSCQVGFFKTGGFTPTDSPDTNAYGAGVGATRVWLFFYDSAGNYISGADVSGGCSRSTGTGVYRIDFNASVPANATQATIFFESVLRSGEYAEFSSIRVIDEERNRYAPTQTRFAYWYNDSGDATYNECRDQYSEPLITPTRVGYTFTGWVYGNGNKVTGNSRVQPVSTGIYSTWEVIRLSVFAMLDAAGGTSTPAILEVTVGDTYAGLPTPERSNYSFDGWFTAASGGTQVTSATTVTSTVNHILYAHWTAQSTPAQDGDLIYDDATGRLIYDDKPVTET